MLPLPPAPGSVRTLCWARLDGRALPLPCPQRAARLQAAPWAAVCSASFSRALLCPGWQCRPLARWPAEGLSGCLYSSKCGAAQRLAPQALCHSGDGVGMMQQGCLVRISWLETSVGLSGLSNPKSGESLVADLINCPVSPQDLKSSLGSE